MRFSEKDLSDQFISLSYQDVLQQYNTTGSSLYVLDGYGNVVFGIPTASLGYNVITSDITSSMTVLSASYSQVIDIQILKESSSFASSSISASYAESASYSLTSAYADSAGTAVYSEYAGTASLAAEAVTASYSETASYVDPSSIDHNQLSGLQGGSGSNYYHLDSASFSQVLSGTSSYSFFAGTSSYAEEAGITELAISASHALTASYAENAGGGTTLETGSYYPISASWADSASVVISSSYSLTASYALNGGSGGGISLETGSTYPITSSWSLSSSFAQYSFISDFCLLAGDAINATNASSSLTSDFSLLAGDVINSTSASYSLTASYTQISNTSSYALNYNKIPHRTITGSYFLTNDDYLIYANASSGSIVLTMPDPSLVPEQIFKTKKIDSTGHEVIISSSVNIDYNTELRLSQSGASVTLHSDSTQYWIH